ncbi:MAG: hypothetical protein JWP00_2075 [Chloroflexi bacterium]|nr:hypothetical protein [Chloroflexota bacterium]
MTFTLIGLIIYLVMGFVGGTATEQIAKRKFWPPIGLLGAILVAFGGAIIGAWLGYLIGLREPDLFESRMPVIPALIGLILFMIPWFMVRGGYTSYGKQRTWQRKYRR